MKLKFYLTIGFCLILGGFLMDSGKIIELIKNQNDTASSTQVYAEASKDAKADNKRAITGFPNHIELPDVDISLPVQAGIYDPASQKWTLSKTSAYFATTTMPPNTVEGNTFIYGHEMASVFSRLKNIKPGEEAIIKTDNGHTFTYKFVGSHETTPNDVSLFSYKGKPVLTLQTCSGFYFQNRHLFVFSLVEAK